MFRNTFCRDKHVGLFSGKIPFHVTERLTVRYWVPHFCHSSLSPLFATIRDYSQPFATIQDYLHYSYYLLFTILDYRHSLFAIQVFQTPHIYVSCEYPARCHH